MIKKILLATALVASASFATWDKFPVLENGKGQAHVGIGYNIQGDWSGMDIYVGARYTVIPNLELGLNLPYTIFTDYDGEDGADGLGNLAFMLRYQFMPIMNAFVDVDFPIGEEGLVDDGFGLHFGVQYSSDFGMFALGSELGFALATAGDDDFTPAYELNVGAELDFAVSSLVTPYVGLDLNMKVTDSEFDGKGGDVEYDDSGDMGLWLCLGGDFVINPMFDVDVSLGFGFGEDYYGEDTPIGIDAHLNVNF